MTHNRQIYLINLVAESNVNSLIISFSNIPNILCQIIIFGNYIDPTMVFVWVVLLFGHVCVWIIIVLVWGIVKNIFRWPFIWESYMNKFIFLET